MYRRTTHIMQESENPMKFKDSFHPYAIVTILFWSLAYVLTRLTLVYFSAFSLGFLRYAIASAVLVVLVLATRMKLPRKADIPWLILSGGVGFFLYMILFNKGQAQVTAATGSVVIATVPVITALLARFFYKETLRRHQWVAIGIEFAGVAVLTLLNGVFSVGGGLFWLFGAAAALSVYNLLQRRLTRTCTALQTSAYSIFFGAAMLAIFLPISIKEVGQAPASALVYVVILGVFSSAIAYVCWSKAFTKASNTSQVSNYMFLTPFCTSILGILIANEVPDLATLVGGGIILLGVLVFNFGGKRVRAGK